MSLSPVAIKEANDHISMLHLRVHELEEKCRKLNEALETQNKISVEQLSVIPLRMNQTLIEKDEEIAELTSKLKSAQKVIGRLEVEISEKDALVRNLQDRSRVLDKIVMHRQALENIVTCLNVLQMEDEETLEEAISNYNDMQETDITGSPVKSSDGRIVIERADSGIITNSDTSVALTSDIDSDLSLPRLSDPDTKRKILENEFEAPTPEFV